MHARTQRDVLPNAVVAVTLSEKQPFPLLVFPGHENNEDVVVYFLLGCTLPGTVGPAVVPALSQGGPRSAATTSDVEVVDAKCSATERLLASR